MHGGLYACVLCDSLFSILLGERWVRSCLDGFAADIR
jgi:hypothetical protein